jgi:hypothetical protein
VILTPDELAALTKKRRPTAQAKVLDHLGIPSRQRPDGTLVVLHAHVADIPPIGQRREPELRLGT